MISNPNDSALEKRVAALEELLRANPFESASVKNGRLRFIGGLLRVDSGGRVQIVGTLEIDGHTTSTGVFDINGPWDLAGDGTITGNVSIAGNVTATGEWTQIGEWHLNGNGSITGNVDITGLLTLMSNLRVSTLGKIIVNGADGDTVLQDSRITFANGGALRADSAGVQVVQGNAQVAAFAGLARLRAGIRTLSVSDTGGYTITGLPTIPRASANNATVGTLYVDSSGSMYRVV